jgi:hypothetical protein
MSIITLCFVGGVIQPPQPVIYCHLEMRCHQPYIPQPIINISTHAIEVWEEIKNHFEEKVDRGSLDFWQQRMVVRFATAPPFCSLSFYPADFTSNQTWFIQKGKTEPPMNGFWAPYLTKKTQKKWGCLESLPRPDLIATPEDIDRSIKSLPPSIYPEMRSFLNDFLQDPLSQMVGFTYIVDSEGAQETRFWYK